MTKLVELLAKKAELEKLIEVVRQAEQAELDRQIEAARIAEKEDVIRQIVASAKNYEISYADLRPYMTRRRRRNKKEIQIDN